MKGGGPAPIRRTTPTHAQRVPRDAIRSLSMLFQSRLERRSCKGVNYWCPQSGGLVYKEKQQHVSLRSNNHALCVCPAHAMAARRSAPGQRSSPARDRGRNPALPRRGGLKEALPSNSAPLLLRPHFPSAPLYFVASGYTLTLQTYATQKYALFCCIRVDFGQCNR